MRQFAEELLALEDKGVEEPWSTPKSGFRVCEKLRVPLTSLAGSVGYEALLSRALALAKAEFPRLQPVTVKQGDCMAGLDKIEPPLRADEAAEGETLIVGYLLELLILFLGEALLLRLIHDVWPATSFTNTNPGEGSSA